MPLMQSPLGNLFDTAYNRKMAPDLLPAGDLGGQVPALSSAPVPGGGGGGGGAAPLMLGSGKGGGGGPRPIGVAAPSLGGAVARWASWAPRAPQAPLADIIRQANVPQLSANPQLPQHPLGAYTDSEYEASNALLQQQINAAYQDVLTQTGYTGPSGEHIAGDVELAAARQERDLLTGMMNAVNEQVGQMQQAGTIFSGYNATTRAAAEQPFITGLGDLAVNTPRTLTRLYQQAEDLMREYTTQQNLLLMQAAQRRAAALAAAQAATPGAVPTGDGISGPMSGAAVGGDSGISGIQGGVSVPGMGGVVTPPLGGTFLPSGLLAGMTPEEQSEYLRRLWGR